MKHYQLTITSKNKKSIENCFLFFFNNANKLNLNIIKKNFKKKKKKTILTILKSPHVNKSAQEQFEFKLFSKQLSLYSQKNFQILFFLKKIKIYLFPDVKMKIKFILNKNLSEKIKVHIFNPTNFKLNVLKEIKLKKYTLYGKKKTKNRPYNLDKKFNLEKTQHLLKTFDIYSELQKINS